MNIGKIIYKLRQEKCYTQEKLAGLLGITTGAVSKWESGNAYPDITLIPKIAEIFNISTDYLFDRNDTLNKSIDEIISEAKQQNFDVSAQLLTAALERYPNNPRLMYELAWCKCMYAKELGPECKLINEATELFEKLTRIPDDDTIRAHSFDRLSKIALLQEDYEKALYYNSKILPPDGLYPSSEYAIIKLRQLDNDEALHTAKQTLYRNIYEYSNTLNWILAYYHNHDMTEAGINEASRGIKLLELFDFSGYFFQDLSIYYEYLAFMHALREEFDDTLGNLETAYKYALKCDTETVTENYKLFGSVIDEQNITYNERKDLLACILSPSRVVYDPIRETPRFRAVIAALEDV